MLLNVVYGHNCGDKTAADIASTHCAALVSLAQASDLMRPVRVGRVEPQDSTMDDDGNWKRRTEQAEQLEWLRWKTMEERKRTLYAVFIMSSLLVSAYNHTPALTNSEVFLDLPSDEEFYSAESSTAFAAMGGISAADHNRMTFHDALGELLRTNERQHMLRPGSGFGLASDPDELSKTDLTPSTFGCLILINALHNYIWETRQRHHNKIWTNEETEKMHRHIEPALKAWQAAWENNPKHRPERPNPFGLGPLSSDCIPMLDLAYIRLFVNMSRSKERFWQRDYDGMAMEISKGMEIAENAGVNRSDATSEDLSPTASGPAATDGMETNQSSTNPSRREKHLRKAAFFAAGSLSMSDKLNLTFSENRELSLQSTMCAFDCAQVLAEWVASLQDRVGGYLGILGHDEVDFAQMPALMLLEEEDIQLLKKVEELLSSIEMKMSLEAGHGTNGPNITADGHHGFATKILRVTAYTLNRSAVWPVTNLTAQCLETQAAYAKARAERSVVNLSI